MEVCPPSSHCIINQDYGQHTCTTQCSVVEICVCMYYICTYINVLYTYDNVEPVYCGDGTYKSVQLEVHW